MKDGRQQNIGKKPTMTSKRKIIAMTCLTLGNVFAVSAATIAWFTMATESTVLSTVSGDMNVSIKKVSAWKYMYPFYENSTEFINYDRTGTIKKYTIEDASITDNVSLTSATFTVETVESQPIVIPPASSEALGPRKIYHDESEAWRYYLVGGEVFNGVGGKDWHTSSAIPFAEKQDVEDQDVEIDNVIVSAGAEFMLFDAETISGSTCSYFSYGDASSGAPFKQVDNNRIRCLKSGIYNFSYQLVDDAYQLIITANGRDDNSIIGNNILDPTKITIDWRGRADKEDYPEPEDYMAQGIFDQKTSVILDVELGYRNTNDIEAGLKVLRDSRASQSIYSLAGKYSNVQNDVAIGYVPDGARYPMLASDFYSYYAVMRETPFANANALWDAMHRLSDSETDSVPDFSKFSNDGPQYETVTDCLLHADPSSLIIPGRANDAPEAIRHCYISIEYDYEHCRFFLEPHRLSKTYYLKRDIGFRFIGTQKRES